MGRQSLISLYIREAWRKSICMYSAGPRLWPRFRGSGNRRLLVAPTDLRAVDPFVADEIIAGRFPLAGRVLIAENRSPFSFELPSELFAVRLHSFTWLRHMRANKTTVGCASARMVVDDWITFHGRRQTGVAWELDVVAQRVIAWLSHSPVVLQDADGGFYRRFIGSLSNQIGFLRRHAKCAPDGFVRFRVRIALAMASIAMEARASTVSKAASALNREIDRQILPDGGHVSRNPQAAVELLFDLLPLRQTYINLGHDVPAKLIPAIDRMYPAIRFFRHQGGDLALFNGATSTLANELMAVLRYDETAGQPFKALPHTDFQRLAAGETTLIIDTGRPLSSSLSRTSHAGCLSFELSSGKNRFIINSGSPRFAGEKLRQLSRDTAAHSTVVVGDRPSSRISRSRFLGPIFVAGVTDVKVTRQTATDGSDRLVAQHDGYLEDFGLIHEREIRISSDGNKVVGRDRLLLPGGTAVIDTVPQATVARFHVHPAIKLSHIDGQTVRMEAASGESWIFKAGLGDVSITEDVFFADASGVRPSEQIELAFKGPEVRWFLSHHA